MLVWVGTAPGVTWGHGYNMRFRMMRWSEHPLIHDSATCTASRRVKRLNTQGGGGVRAGEETHWGGGVLCDARCVARGTACGMRPGGGGMWSPGLAKNAEKMRKMQQKMR